MTKISLLKEYAQKYGNNNNEVEEWINTETEWNY